MNGRKRLGGKGGCGRGELLLHAFQALRRDSRFEDGADLEGGWRGGELADESELLSANKEMIKFLPLPDIVLLVWEKLTEALEEIMGIDEAARGIQLLFFKAAKFVSQKHGEDGEIIAQTIPPNELRHAFIILREIFFLHLSEVRKALEFINNKEESYPTKVRFDFGAVSEEEIPGLGIICIKCPLQEFDGGDAGIVKVG